MPISSQPNTKVRPYENIIRQKVKTDQTVQSKNHKEVNKSNKVMRAIDEQQRVRTAQFWKQHGELKSEISKEREEMQQIRIANANTTAMLQQGTTDPIEMGRKRRRAATAKSRPKSVSLVTSNAAARPTSSTSISFSRPNQMEDLDYDLLPRNQRILRMQREANKEVSEWVKKFKMLRHPGVTEEDEGGDEDDYF
ncbi:uncharacterized protein LOC142344170 [Convolutriloba macropyga]|uniref:uncharacterized protein LOC142344170 n=1 Tax=Convolutriloba macropyga TaxID=536237 RepID=UPI003F52413A